MCASGSVGLLSASCKIGTVEALYERMNGGVVPGGENAICDCETAVICAIDRSLSTPGWKKYFTIEVPTTDWDSVCSTSLTTVCAVRSESRIIRFAISSGR